MRSSSARAARLALPCGSRGSSRSAMNTAASRDSAYSKTSVASSAFDIEDGRRGAAQLRLRSSRNPGSCLSSASVRCAGVNGPSAELAALNAGIEFSPNRLLTASTGGAEPRADDRAAARSMRRVHRRQSSLRRGYRRRRFRVTWENRHGTDRRITQNNSRLRRATSAVARRFSSAPSPSRRARFP